MTSVRPHLWFGNNRAAEAARFYADHIPNSSVNRMSTAPEGVPGAEEGSEFIVEFTVGGLDVVALNAGPEFKASRGRWSPSVSKNCPATIRPMPTYGR